MRESAEEIKAHGVELLAICPADGQGIQQFLDVYGPYPFRLLGDPELTAYKALGHVHLSPFVSYSKAALVVITGQVKELIPKDRAKRNVMRQAYKHQDIHIQGGTWLFDANGNVLWKHIDKDATHHATIEQILEQIKQG